MTCKQILYNYIKENDGWHKKVHLYQVAEDYSPENVGRRLRELEEEGKIEAGKYDGKYTKNLVKYILKGMIPSTPKVILKDGTPYLIQ
jgi:DNA-binding transcriptional ArsR family regulator